MGAMKGITFVFPTHERQLFTDASNSGAGGSYNDTTTVEGHIHINCLEMRLMWETTSLFIKVDLAGGIPMENVRLVHNM